MGATQAGDRGGRFGGGRRRIRVVVLAGGAIIGGAGLWLVARGDVAAHFAARDARSAIARQRWAEAAPALERWMAFRPESAEAHFLKARVAFEQGRLAEVGTLLDRAQWLGYPERPLYRLRALRLVRLRRFIEAEPILLHLLDESAMPDPPLDEALARVFLETYRLETAVKVLERWIRDDPRDPARISGGPRSIAGWRWITPRRRSDITAPRWTGTRTWTRPGSAWRTRSVISTAGARRPGNTAATSSINRAMRAATSAWPRSRSSRGTNRRPCGTSTGR